jgi:hypothetical protein
MKEDLTFGNLAEVAISTTDKDLVPLSVPNMSFNRALGTSISEGLDSALIVGAIALVNIGSRSITLEVGHGVEGCVDGQLLVVCSKTVTLGVGVREETGLENGIRRGLDVWDEVGWGKGDLSYD